jgi:hypothetical protein
MTHELPVTRRTVLAAGAAALGAVMTQTAPAANEDLPWVATPTRTFDRPRWTSTRSPRG